MTCGTVRLIVVAWAAGIIASSISGSDTIGWLAAGVAVALAVAIGRFAPRRVTAASCAVTRCSDSTEAVETAPVAAATPSEVEVADVAVEEVSSST